jgi:hypothetical protein
MDHVEIVRLYDRAYQRCVTEGKSIAWLFEKYYAEEIAEHCAKIAQDCSDHRIPLSQVPDMIRKFERLEP